MNSRCLRDIGENSPLRAPCPSALKNKLELFSSGCAPEIVFRWSRHTEHLRWDCGRVAASEFADRGSAAHSLGSAQLAFERIGLDRHPTCFGVLVNVDLDRRPAGKVPPGGPLLCRFMRFYLCGSFVSNFHFPGFHHRRRRFQHQLGTISGHTPQFE